MGGIASLSPGSCRTLTKTGGQIRPEAAINVFCPLPEEGAPDSLIALFFVKNELHSHLCAAGHSGSRRKTTAQGPHNHTFILLVRPPSLTSLSWRDRCKALTRVMIVGGPVNVPVAAHDGRKGVRRAN